MDFLSPASYRRPQISYLKLNRLIYRSCIDLKLHKLVHRSCIDLKLHTLAHRCCIDQKLHKFVHRSCIDLKLHKLLHRSCIDLKLHELCMISMAHLKDLYWAIRISWWSDWNDRKYYLELFCTSRLPKYGAIR